MVNYADVEICEKDMLVQKSFLKDRDLNFVGKWLFI